MPEYSGLFRKMPVNASGMDFSLKCRHFLNPAYAKCWFSHDVAHLCIKIDFANVTENIIFLTKINLISL